MKAYFEWINIQGGIHGRKIELYVKDDRYDPSRTPRVAKQLAEDDRVLAVVGGIGTAGNRAAAPVLASAGVPMFTPASGAAWFSGPESPATTRTVYLPYAAEGRLLGKALVERDLKRVAVLYQDDDFGHEGRDGLKEGLTDAGGELIATAPLLPTDIDVSAAVSAVLKEAPEALVLYLAPRQAVLVGRNLAGREQRPQLVTSFVLADPGIIARAGAEVWEGTLTSVVSQLADDHEAPAVAQFRKIMADHAPGLRPGGFAMSGVRFAQPLVEALHRAGPNLTRESLLAAIDSLKDYRGGGPYWQGEGLGAPVDFGSGKLGVDALRFARAQEGRWVAEGEWVSASGAAPK